MKALFIIVPILLVGGTLGAAAMGVVNIPGVTPKKAVAKSNSQYAPDSDAPTIEEENSQPLSSELAIEDPASVPEQEQAGVEPKGVSAKPKTDIEQGARVVAKYWDQIETLKLILITDTYKERDLAQILIFMQKSKVAELLSKVPADRAAGISRELQSLASVVKDTAE